MAQIKIDNGCLRGKDGESFLKKHENEKPSINFDTAPLEQIDNVIKVKVTKVIGKLSKKIKLQ
ncbi:MAG: hypothetical protein Q8P68_05655 [Candidatus Peregrinibacteria bacterium]|nr:hypothetical protein [Candidatus Peregrinibacteria bacterium]